MNEQAILASSRLFRQCPALVCLLIVLFAKTPANGEMLVIPSNGNNVSSSPLPANTLYRVTASGIFAFALGGNYADAAGYYSSNWNTQKPALNLVGGGINWRGFASNPLNHVYSADVIGQNSALSFLIQDNQYNDNSGNLVVDITKLPIGISGYVSSALNGSAISGASVQIGSYSAITDLSGNYNISDVLIGNYTAIITAGNYGTATASVVVSGTSQSETANFTLYPSQATVFVVANPTQGGTVSGGGTFEVGSQQQITATPTANWNFMSWNDGSIVNPRTIIISAGGATYTANFARQTATLSVVASPATGGTVSGGGIFDVGSQQQISATASSFYIFTGWTDGNTDNPRTITVPSEGVSHTANFSPTAVISFYHELPDTIIGVGHAFLEVKSSRGASGFYGFYPKGNLFYSPGQVTKNDQFSGWDFKITYPITDAQYASAGAVITHDWYTPPDYSIILFNCMDWVAKVATAAGVQLPPYRTATSVVSDPFIFGMSLLGLGAGTHYQGGVVAQNSSLASFARTSVVTSAAPFDYSYAGIASAGHTDAAGLAASIGLAYDQVNLGTVNANDVGGLTLNLTGADATRDLISMKWGDGSAYQEQSLTHSHVYGAGTFSAHLLIVDAGAVHSYGMTVVVSSSVAALVNVNVTPFPPVSIVNQGLVAAEPVPDFIVVQSKSISMQPNGHAILEFIGIPTWTYTIEATNNLTQGFLPVATKTAGGDGKFQFDDPDAVSVPRRFYRARFP